jgi:hypothetical protein
MSTGNTNRELKEQDIAAKVLKDGMMIEVDANVGIVRIIEGKRRTLARP